MNKTNFKDSLKKGKKGEKVVIERLLELSYTSTILDVSDKEEYRDIDVDCLWYTSYQIEPYSLEIKSDNYNSGNFFFETTSCKETGSSGCFMYSEADVFAYYFTKKGIIYLFNLPKIRKTFIEFINKFEEKSCKTFRYDGSCYTTIGRLVPIKKLVKSKFLRTVRI